MRLSNIIFCLATAVVVTAQSDAQSDREVRGKCLTDTWRAHQGDIGRKVVKLRRYQRQHSDW